jgi:hypothetical protein
MIYIDQEDQVLEFLESYEVQPSHFAKVATPYIDKHVMYGNDEMLNDEEASKYRSIIGSLNYFSSSIRYDIAQQVSKLSQFMQHPTKGAKLGVERVMRYIACTSNFSIEGKVTRACEYTHYSDSDHAGDKPYSTRSQTGIFLTLNNVPVHWKSNKQTATAYSSAAAEVMALSESIRQARFLQWAGIDMGYAKVEKVYMRVDSKGARYFQSSSVLDSRLKGYFDLREAWIQELRDLSKVGVVAVSGELNLSDLLTKPLKSSRFKSLLRLIQGGPELEG